MNVIDATHLPVIVDIDSGGTIPHAAETLRLLERIGAAAACLEDKTGDKHNSLSADAAVHCAASIDGFSRKIAAAREALVGDDFLIVARLEGLILGQSRQEMLDRAGAYVEAGADCLVLHSKDLDPSRLFELAASVRQHVPGTPLVAIPSAYPSVSEAELVAAGFSVVVYANQMFRASVKAMASVSKALLDGESAQAAESMCVSIAEVLAFAERQR